MASCCTNYSCSGSDCIYFSNWTFSGADTDNTDNCNLYVSCVVFGTSQQIEIYSDTGLTDLVAIGQKNGSGTISLNERNSSGLSGSVDWDGTLISYPSFLTLFCDTSSSSSTSSVEYSSSSSQSSTSSFSSSSSESYCCASPFCVGSAECSHFSSWLFSGMSQKNTDDCILYIIFDEVVAGEQQVRLYKDSSFSSLVAAGQKSGGAGSVSLNSKNGSGLNGTVQWDGTMVSGSVAAMLDCDLSSSSSSTLSSNSSSSSSSLALSSSSSYSSSSSSSSSNSSSTSSSSSVDSSSTSSESIGNFSSSSSSSLLAWNKIKPLILGMSAVNSVTIKNRLAQTIKIVDETYSIGKVYCYFYGSFGLSDAFIVHLDVYFCNNDGKPSSIIASSTINGSSITENGWYDFDIDVNGVTPSNGLLSFVIWQENGDENNYVLWGYSTSILNDTIAWFSDDSSTWVKQEGIIRAIKIVGDFDAYDLTDFRLLSPPAEEKITSRNATDGSLNNLKLIKGGEYDLDRVVLDHPDFICSIVVDSSGSMGWNDRFDGRIDMIRNFIGRFKNHYPSQSKLLFDIIKFGSTVLDTNVVTSDLSKATTINVDLNNPTRTTYTFVSSFVDINEGAVYKIQDKTYTVIQNAFDNILICQGSEDPPDNGTLTLQSGTGDLNVSYSAYTKASVSDSIVAYGYKNFESNHNYNIATLKFDNALEQEIELKNWQVFLEGGGSVSLSISNNGPDNSSSLDFKGKNGLVLRKVISPVELETTTITNNIDNGDELINVGDTDIASTEEFIDLIDGSFASLGHQVADIIDSRYLLSSGSNYNIKSWNNDRGIAQYSSLRHSLKLNATTGNILVKDPLVTKSITFFVQTNNGLMIEWDLQPYSDWIQNAFYWLGETALLPVKVFDNEGEPLPDGTKVKFYVGNRPSGEQNEVSSVSTTSESSLGSNKVFVESTTGFRRGDSIDIVDPDGFSQNVNIEAIGEDELKGPFVLIDTVLKSDFKVNTQILIVQSPKQATGTLTNSNLLPSLLGMVDVTPIYSGRNLDTDLLKNYDPTPVSPSTDYSDINLDRDRIKNNINDVPTIDGNAVIRILPITEDNLKTIQDKESVGERLFSPEVSPSITNQLEQNEDDIENSQVDKELAENQFTTTTTTLLSKGEDYDIDNPVYLSGGFAQSSIISFATNLIPKEVDGYNIAGLEILEGDDDGFIKKSNTILVKEYEIFPSVVVQDSNGTDIAKQYLDPFNIFFTPPISIKGVYDKEYGGVVEYLTDDGFQDKSEETPGLHKGYSVKYAPGAYATDKGVKIDYLITSKGTLLNNGRLNIKIYSNPIINLDKVVSERSSFLTSDGKVSSKGRDSYRREDLNVKNYTQFSEQGELITTDSNINQWRQAVENNPQSQRIENTSEESNPNTSKTKLLTDVAGEDLTEDFLSNIEKLGYEIDGQKDIEESKEFDWYTNPEQWTLATQYGDLAEQIITINNGKASLELPTSNIPSLVMVQASIEFGDGNKFEVISSNLFITANPINVGRLTPSKIFVENDGTYELATDVTWLNEPISDNVIVNITPQQTNAIPSVSKTNNGLASGVKIGPHENVTMKCPIGSPDCIGEYELISINVSYLGYDRTVERLIEWTGSAYEVRDVEEPFRFPFYIKFSSDSDSIGWADGTTILSVQSDLKDPQNQLWIGSEGIKALKGKDQPKLSEYPNGAPRRIKWDVGDLKVKPDQERWESDVVSAQITGPNLNIGYEQPSQSSCCPVENNPWNVFVKASTNYRIINNDGETIDAKVGTGVINKPYPKLCGYPVVCWPQLELKFKEPLGISLDIESINNEFVRDGETSADIVATVTWKGEPIRETFILNEGLKDETSINFPLPNVAFEAGICEEINTISDSDSTKAKDAHNLASGCYSIGSHSDIKLDSYVSSVSLSRTDVYRSTEHGNHTHAISIDDNGNGITTEIIKLTSYNIPNHTHNISSFEVDNSGSIVHSHNLRSVAIVKLLPTTNANLTITINGKVDYNPTNASGGRYMKDTLYIKSAEKEKRLLLSINNYSDARIKSPMGNAYTSESVTKTEKGFDILANAKISSHTIKTKSGETILIPEKTVNDGSRITFEINVFKSPESSSDLLVVGTDKIREYIYIRIKATLNVEGLTATETKILTVLSDLQWLPVVKRLVPDMTKDSIYIDKALDSIGAMGASQIHDAVKNAAQNLIQYQTDNPGFKLAQKAILLLTDGDENTSEHSIDQAINNVQFIDGNCKTPVIPVKLGYAYSSDTNLLKKYSEDTCGELLYLINGTSSDIENLINEFIVGTTLGVNDGLFSDIIDLGSNNVPIKFALNNTSIPSNSKILFRYRYSLDRTDWSDWSQWVDSSTDSFFELNLDSLGRYFQYEIRLFGNEFFESPILFSGMELSYYKSQSFITFFQPIDLDIDNDEYLASIHITHEATIPDTSLVKYGYSQFDTVDVEDYYCDTRPLVEPDRHTITLTRYNELFLTDDKQTYMAINGGWPDKAEIEIYKINETFPNGVLMNSSEYSANNNTGEIKFQSVQDDGDKFILNVYFDPSFRMFCNIQNFGPESVVIDHIGVLYNISKRIPRDSDGNNINVPLNKRI